MRNPQTYTFSLGTFQCIAVSDGTLTYAPPMFPPPATLLFPNADADRRADRLKEHDVDAAHWGSWTSSYTCLLIKTPEHTVLVDTGAGHLSPDTGRLLENLQADSIFVDDIDTVIITHAHPDHLGGLTDDDGNIIFRKARHVMSKNEWDFWMSDEAERALHEHGGDMLIQIARKNLRPLTGQIGFVDDEEEIVPGIKALAAPGHTPGQILLEVSSEGQRLLCLSDVVLHPIHLQEPGWYAAVDTMPEATASTRTKFLESAEARRTLVHGFHMPFPGLGHVVRDGVTWSWQPAVLV